MKLFFHELLIVLATFLVACGTTLPPTGSQLPFILITSAPNATPTSTPFQPPEIEQVGATSLYNIVLPTLEPFFQNIPGFPNGISPGMPTAPIDLGSLFPKAAAPPIPNSSGDYPTPQPQLTDSRSINFLLIGSDKRPGGSFRTDTIVVVMLWPKQAQVSMISIPRDLWAYIPTIGMQRINTAYESGEIYGYQGGGPGLLRDTIAYNLGIRIDHTALVEFDGFRKIVDTLGGLDIPVSCPYTDWHLSDPKSDPENADNWSLYTVQTGIIHMDGDLALWYARSRLKSSDFDRGRRQQEVLRSIFTQVLKTGTLAHIPQLYNDFSKTIVTDLALPDILKLALYAPSLTNASIRSYYIRPPYVSDWTTPAGADVLLPDQPALEQMLVQAATPLTAEVQRQAVSIEIENGTPFNGWELLAANRLNYAGYDTHTSPSNRSDYTKSVLIDFTASQDPNARAAILRILGINSATFVAAPNPKSDNQYGLVLGSDYQPCFQPEDLSH